MANGKRLGKGLDALLGDAYGEATTDQIPQDASIMEIEINRLDPNPNQPRQQFEQEALQELSDSIALHGVIQPLLVTRGEAGRYTIIAGERRWRAARMAGLATVPAILREYGAQELMEVSLIENLQRSDLNPVEEAEAVRLLMDAHGLTQEQVAERVGKSRPAIANALRLLVLQKEILDMLRDGRLTSGHARALLSIPDTEKRLEIANQIVRQKLSVRQAEQLAAGRNNKPAKKVQQDTHLRAAEDELRRSLGTKVAIVGSAKRGKITIEYYSQDDLDRIYDIMVTE